MRNAASRLAALGGTSVAAVLWTSCSFGMPRGATDQGRDIFHLWQIFFVVAIPIAGIVYGLIFWSVVRYRRRRSDAPGALGAQFSDHRAIELIYTGIPILIVIFLFAASLVVEDRVDALSPHPDVTLDVQAYQWGWRFGYVDQGVTIVSPPSGEFVTGPQIALPLGQTVRIVLTSNDVIHAFWVPGFLYKHDAIPGRTFRFDVTPRTAGTFLGECAEFCGLNHAYMTFSIRVLPPSQFAAWLAEHEASPSPGASP
jgi:cytochrome c oxidase subunit II